MSKPSDYTWGIRCWKACRLDITLMGQEVSGLQTPVSTASAFASKSVRLHIGVHTHQIPLTDSSLTMGWLLSEAIRLSTGPETVVGLRTQEGAEVMDVLLQSLSRSCAVLRDREGLEVVMAGKRQSRTSGFPQIQPLYC